MSAMPFNDRKVVVLGGRYTWLETIHLNNVRGRVMVPNSFYNDLFLGKGTSFFGHPPDRYKSIPNEFANALPLYSGTAAVIGAKGKPLGKSVENECIYNKTKKTAIFKANSSQASLVDTVLLCDHGFTAAGTPMIQLFNAKTNQPIHTDEDMSMADEVLVKFNGEVRQIKITTRLDGIFENIGDGHNTFTKFTDFAVLGLVDRSYANWSEYGRGGVYFGFVGLNNHPSCSCSVAVFE